MNNQEINSLISIVHKDASVEGVVRMAAISRLWSLCEVSLMKTAVCLFRKIQPDFSLNELSEDSLLAELSARVYGIFVNAVMKYDASQKASFETYTKNEIKWRFKDEKCDNAARAAHEVVVECMPDGSDDGKNWEEYGYVENDESEQDDLTNAPSTDDNDYGLEWKKLLDLVYGALKDHRNLLEFLNSYLAVMRYCERREEAETAECLGISRATVYNRLAKIRDILKEKQLDREFKLLLAA